MQIFTNPSITLSSNVFINAMFSCFLLLCLNLNFNHSRAAAFLGNTSVYKKPWDFPVLESVAEFLHVPCFPLPPVMTDANQLRCHLQEKITLRYWFRSTLFSEILHLVGETVISKHISSDLTQNSSQPAGVEGAQIKSFDGLGPVSAAASSGSPKEDLGVKRI